MRFVFFGNEPLAGPVLEELTQKDLRPERSISSTELSPDLIDTLSSDPWDVFAVASYGKILPARLLELPRRGVVNVHPSLLPRLRGPSPIRSAILNDEKETGVSIMLLDEKMDHGPLIAQKKVPIADWPPSGVELDKLLAHQGGKLLAIVLPLWVDGRIEARAQNHDLATYCAAFKKADAEINLQDDPYHNLLKIRAFEGWPWAYTFFERAGKRLRVQLIDAHLENQKLVIDRVKPEGKREMTYDEFLRSGAKPI